MRARKYTDDDYCFIKKWFQEHGKSAPAESELPATGIIVDDIAAGFLYKTDCSIAMLECFVSNPKANKREVLKAINFIIEQLTVVAELIGYSKICGFTRKRSMKRVAKKLMFQQAERNYTLISKGIH